MGMMGLFLLLTVNSFQGLNSVSEEVDLIELNHFHDCVGRHVYDQVIFYEWSPESNRYDVRAWCLIEDKEIISRRPRRTYSDGRYQVQWLDRDCSMLRSITSTHFSESWTQVDPERANKKVLDERLRTSFIKRQPDRNNNALAHRPRNQPATTTPSPLAVEQDEPEDSAAPADARAAVRQRNPDPQEASSNALVQR